MTKYLLLLLLQLLCLPVMAGVFVVNKNADAGTGTLRQALTDAAANSNAAQNYITFNIPDQTEAGRTITLLSALPEVSSNLIIDASTQPGQKIGISDAKIIITLGNVSLPGDFKCFWGINKSNIEIDGFYFSSVAAADGSSAAMYFNNVSTLVIGRSGKGNVFGMVDTPVSITLSSRITISANFFGIDPKTSLPAATTYGTNLQISASTNIKIGGDFYLDGNVFVKSQPGHESLITGIDNCTFKCNTFGYKTSNGGSGCAMKFNNIGQLIIVSNIYNYGSVNYITNVTTAATIKSNRTNLDSKQFADPASTSATPFELENVKKTTFGGVNLNEGNIINNPAYGNDYPALLTKNCGDVLLQRNSISCKSSAAPYASNASKVVLPLINITAVNSKVISGTATPNAVIELFSDSQCQLCEPNTYLGSVTATAAGAWSYTTAAPLSGFTASASLNGRTSLFAKVGYDATSVIATAPTCGNQDGSIKGIKVMSSTRTEWTDQTGRVISNNLDIANLAPGTYTFKAYLGTYCHTESVSFTLDGISMDESQKSITPANCLTGKGAITGIKISGATSYQWFNSNNISVAGTVDLVDAAPGNYYLTASNSTCSVNSPVYTITQQTSTINYGSLTPNLKEATCGMNNGSIEVMFNDNPPALPKAYRWVNHASGLTVSTTTIPAITGLDAGTYDLYVTDNASCEKLLTSYTITRLPGLTVNSNNVQVNNDNCGTGMGSIKGLMVTGKPPLNITWTDAGGKTIGTTANLLNVQAGTYHVRLTDGAGCEQGFTYTVVNQFTIIPLPVVPDLQVCSAGEATVAVNQPLAQYSYRLYETGGSIKPLDEQKSGRFKINVKANRSYYVSQYTGTCESGRAEAKVNLEMKPTDIDNTFSPNGDGINDYWKITSIENYPKAEVHIFARDGQKVYQSTGYAIPFNGTYNGRQLPVGTYYYIINLHTGCTLLSGSLTLIR